MFATPLLILVAGTTAKDPLDNMDHRTVIGSSSGARLPVERRDDGFRRPRIGVRRLRGALHIATDHGPIDDVHGGEQGRPSVPFVSHRSFFPARPFQSQSRDRAFRHQEFIRFGQARSFRRHSNHTIPYKYAAHKNPSVRRRLARPPRLTSTSLRPRPAKSTPSKVFSPFSPRTVSNDAYSDPSPNCMPQSTGSSTTTSPLQSLQMYCRPRQNLRGGQTMALSIRFVHCRTHPSGRNPIPEYLFSD